MPKRPKAALPLAPVARKIESLPLARKVEPLPLARLDELDEAQAKSELRMLQQKYGALVVNFNNQQVRPIVEEG